jgi:hypothetical protein
VSGSRIGRGLRRASGSLVLLALLAAALGFYVGSPRFLVTSGARPVTTEPASEPSPTESASPAPTPTPSQTATQNPGTSPDRDLPPGLGGQEPGIRLSATPTVQGEFEVVEMVRLADPVSELTVAPPDLTRAGPSLRKTRPVVEALKVTADDRPIKLMNDTVRRATVVRFARSADLFELHYRLRGVTVINKPSSAGRRLGGLGPIVIGVPEQLPVAITVRGHSVLNLSCPCLPEDDQTCAAGRQPRIQVNRNLIRRDALVEVQFNLAATRFGAPR